MLSKKRSLGLAVVSAMFVMATLMTVTGAAAQTEKVLHSFNNTGVGGDSPQAGLIFDSSGNLYGTTGAGSTYNDGTVFELSPTSLAGWSEKVLHIFGSSSQDGTGTFAGVIFDSAGNLYGVAASGGLYGYGDVYELSPNATGGWTEKILHNFNQNGTDGTDPFGGLILDASGNLYGTTDVGGVHGFGIAFELSPSGAASWTETILHQFDNNGVDGLNPEGGLIMDASGNLYGTTTFGGTNRNCNGSACGTVFQLTPGSGGSWTETILHDFGNGIDGRMPQAGLVLDSSGNLYGTTSYGGTHNNSGTVYEVSPAAGGGWTEKVLHSFGGSPIDGIDPVDTLIFDSAGNLYGTTSAGGAYGFGTAFELSPPTSAGWTEKMLHSFGNGKDGQYLAGGLVFDTSGNLYGTTIAGGAYGFGTVFEITP